MLATEFLNMISSLEGVDCKAFETAMCAPPAVSIKLNRRKCADKEILGYEHLEQVKWCESGYYLPERPRFTLNPLLHCGAFYVQDASSMIYETLVAEIVRRGTITSESLVLDLCAAPGGKTTSIINAIEDGVFVVANEVMPQRAKVLRENLLKWGYPDIMVTNSPTGRFTSAGEVFDLIAVDAPCSGEGMMRKDEDAVAQWSRGLIEKCASLQREILTDAVAALRPGGYMIYSTCTFNRHENEDQIEWLISNLGLEAVDLQLPDSFGIGRGVATELPVMRFMPHLTRGEGLFVAVLRKPGQPQPVNRRKAIETLKKNAKVILDGIPHSTVKGKCEIPASEWSLSTTFPTGKYPEVELELNQALSYLHHEALRLPEDAPRGFVVVKYKGLPLGFVKNIGTRANNLFPAEWKIRMQI